MSTVLSVGKVGGAGWSNDRFWPRNTTSRTTAGTASASTLNQNWKACTNVIERMPPKNTVAITTAPAATAPVHSGRLVTIAMVSPAPCSWGSTYSQRISSVNSTHTRRTCAEPSRASAKSGTLNAPDRRIGAATNSNSAR